MAYIDIVNGISLSPLYKGVGHCDSTDEQLEVVALDHTPPGYKHVSLLTLGCTTRTCTAGPVGADFPPKNRCIFFIPAQ